MPRPPDLVTQLAAVAADLAPALDVPDVRALATSVCVTARQVFGAAACSIAELHEEAGTLRYVAAAGRGAEAIIGVDLPLDRGIAGYVASAGMALSVEEVRADPRFAADVARGTGYVPTAVLGVPVTDRAGAVLGVFSVLDRTTGPPGTETLELASAFAAQAALALSVGAAARDLGAVLLEALADAAREGDPALATALRRRAGRSRGRNADIAAIAARLAEISSLAPGLVGPAGRMLDELLGYARASRGRRR